MKRQFFKILPLFCLGLLATTSCSFPREETPPPPSPSSPVFDCETEEDDGSWYQDLESDLVTLDNEVFTQTLEDLFVTHGCLLNTFIIQMFDSRMTDCDQLELYSLFENTQAIGKTIAQVYGERIGNRVTTLLNQHIELQMRYIQALSCHNSHLAGRIFTQASHNGNLLIQFLNIINPYFSYSAERYVFDSYLTNEAEQVVAYSNQNYQLGESLKEQALKDLQDLANHFAKATIIQFNEQYPCKDNPVIVDKEMPGTEEDCQYETENQFPENHVDYQPNEIDNQLDEGQ